MAVENWGECSVGLGLIRVSWGEIFLNLVLVAMIFPGKPPEKAQGSLSRLLSAYNLIQTKKFQILFFPRFNWFFFSNSVLFSHFSEIFG